MRIGLLGGTFDPIHCAHLIAASEVHTALNLDQVIFIPAGEPWQKANQEISPAETRLLMVDLAIAGDPRFTSSDIEIKRPGATYAIDTVRQLLQENPTHEYFWIVGADALVAMPTWHEFSELLKILTIVAVNRNGVSQVKVDFDYKYIEIPEFQISSTQIRQRVSENNSIKYLVPPTVEKFIKELGIYTK